MKKSIKEKLKEGKTNFKKNIKSKFKRKKNLMGKTGFTKFSFDVLPPPKKLKPFDTELEIF